MASEAKTTATVERCYLVSWAVEPMGFGHTIVVITWTPEQLKASTADRAKALLAYVAGLNDKKEDELAVINIVNLDTVV